MKKKTIFFPFFLSIFLAVLLLDTASSLENYGYYKQGQEVRITQVCSEASYVIITSISYPNSSIAVSNVNMSFSDGEYYYFFNDTNEIGRYDVRFISDGCEKSAASYFEITKDGSPSNLIKTDFQLFLFSSISIFLGLVLGAFGYFFDRRILVFASIGFFSAGLLFNYYQTSSILFFPTEAIALLNYALGMLCLAIGIYIWLHGDF